MANIRLTAIGKLARPSGAPPTAVAKTEPRSREAYFAGAVRKTAVLDRSALSESEAVAGPAIIEEATATTLVPPGWQARLIGGGHLVLKPAENS